MTKHEFLAKETQLNNKKIVVFSRLGWIFWFIFSIYIILWLGQLLSFIYPACCFVLILFLKWKVIKAHWRNQWIAGQVDFDF